MLRVLVVGLTDTVGGIETYLKNLVLASDKNEIVFDFIVKKTGKPAVYEDEITAFYGGKNNIFYVSKLKKSFFKCFKEMSQIYNACKYNAIYINTATSSDILYATLFSNGIPIIIHSHYCSNKQRLPNLIFRSYCEKNADVRLACSNKAATWLFRDCSKAKIIHNGINTEQFSFSSSMRSSIRKRLKIGDKDLIIGHVARFSYEKNLMFLIDIVKELCVINNEKKKFENIRLVLCGDGPEKNAIKMYIKKQNLCDIVNLVGTTNHPEELLCAYDAFVMPSLFEGLPMAGVEAQCSGLKCFFSDRIDNQILITDRAKMLHLSENNQKEWAEVIINDCSISYSDRESYVLEVKKHGYDIQDVANNIKELVEEV